jgi:hypothetical protein
MSKSPEIKKDGEFFKKAEPFSTKNKKIERKKLAIKEICGKQKARKKRGKSRENRDVNKKPRKKFKG